MVFFLEAVKSYWYKAKCLFSQTADRTMNRFQFLYLFPCCILFWMIDITLCAASINYLVTKFIRNFTSVRHKVPGHPKSSVRPITEALLKKKLI